jgi:hypothetical protein
VTDRFYTTEELRERLGSIPADGEGVINLANLIRCYEDQDRWVPAPRGTEDSDGST